MGADAILASQGGSTGAPMLLATMMSDAGIGVDGQHRITVLIDGSLTPVTAIAAAGFSGSGNDRVIVTRVGALMYVLGVLIRSNSRVLGATLGVTMTPTSTATTLCSIVMPFPGDLLVVGTLDVSVTATGAGTVVGEINVNGGTALTPQILRSAALTGRWTVGQQWAVAGLHTGDAVNLTARITSTGTVTCNAPHSGFSAFIG